MTVETGHITEAEWEIMRVIWSKVPSTSKYIIETLRESTGWSPTTVKTLLGRLVKKNIIDFESKNKAFYYYPMVTEEECIKKEMQLLIGRVHGGTLNKETPNFLFYGSNRNEYIEVLSKALEANCGRIATELQYTLTDKITVYIHSNIHRLHSALGVLNGPDWLRAGWTWGILHIVSNEYFTDIPAEKVAVHALAEIIIHKINPSAPYWLHQGIAAYEGQWLDERWVKSIIADKISTDKIPSLALLSSDGRTFGDNYGHVYSYTVAKFIAEEYGYDKLVMLLRTPGSYNDVFKFSEDEFWIRWVTYLNKKYA